jgi:glutamate-ammonia-ligase adenylyltransferase
MIDDRQTHSLPATDDGLARLAVFLGYDAPEPFVTVLTDHLARVADHYSGLFSEETGGDRSITGAEPGNLVFTGVEDDPDTLRTLKGMGFTRPEAVSAMVRRWHRGRLRATRSTRAQQILTGLMPDLLKAFAGTANPDGALLKFNEFLANLPAGVQLFSLFQAHPRLLDLVAEIMGTAPRLAAYLSRRAHLLDAVLGEGFFGPLPDRAALAAGLRGELDYGHDFQDILETAWRWSGDAKFQVSVQQLQGLIDAESASPRLTDIADILVETILEAVWDELAQRSGRVPNAAFAVLGYGKLGSRSLTRGSDLDLVFVYQIEDPDSTSDGPRALAPQTYFTRLCQRLITAITAQTSEGQLYEVDIRLRPMGENGPLVSEVAAFERYYAEDAWTWELMALTRARVVVAPTELRRRLETLFRGALGRRRDPDRLVRDVAHMRRRIQAEHGTDQPWNIKHVRGGLIDIEFIAQYLQLREAACHPEVLDPNTARVLEKLSAAGALTMNQAEILIDAARVYHDVQAMMRLSLSGPLDETAAPEGLRQVMARAGGAVDFADLKTKLVDSQQVVLACFEEIIERPAAAVPDQPASEDASNPHGQGN